MKNKYKSNSLRTLIIFCVLTGALNVEASENDWHIRIIAKSPAGGLELIDRGSVLGEMSDSTDQIDKHDLPEIEPFAPPFLTVVFKQEVAGQLQEFNSDFRSLDTRDEREEKEWSFTVKSDDPTRDVTLTWEGDGRLDRMILVDALTGQEIFPFIAGRVKDYTFNMNGATERAFLWRY